MDSKQSLVIDLYKSQYDNGIIETIQTVMTRIYITKGDNPDINVFITNSSSYQTFINLKSMSVEDALNRISKLKQLFHVNMPDVINLSTDSPTVLITTRKLSIKSVNPVLVLSSTNDQYDKHKTVGWDEGLYILESALSTALSSSESTPFTIITPNCNIKSLAVRFFSKTPWFANHSVCKCHHQRLDSVESNMCPVTQIRLNNSSKLRVSMISKCTYEKELDINPHVIVKNTFPVLNIPLNVIAGESITILPADTTLAPFVKYLRDEAVAATGFWMGRSVMLLPSLIDNSLVMIPITFAESLVPPPRNQYVFLDNTFANSYGVPSEDEFRLASVNDILKEYNK